MTLLENFSDKKNEKAQRLSGQNSVTANCLMVGGPGCGKTSLVFSYDTGTFPNTSLPSELIVDRTVLKRGKALNIRVLDTGPVYCILDIAPSLMSAVDVIILCYDVSDRGSMDTAINVLSYLELHSTDCMCCETSCSTKNRVPKLIVVGTKTDLRTNQDTLFEMFDSGKTLVSQIEGKSFAEKIKADSYHEVSALYHEGVDELFDEIYKLFFPSLLERFQGFSKKLTMPAFLPL